MLEWMKRHIVALVIPTIMFALMAAIMAEFMVVDDNSFFSLFNHENLTSQGMLWTWRIGGLVTWPVFMWLLLRPYVRTGDSAHQAILVQTLVVVALYGGGGLWLISSMWSTLVLLEGGYLSLVVPFVALLSFLLPYAYTWGFVAQYGVARDRLASNDKHGWISRSLGATVLGIYGIGILIYLALLVVLAPVTMIVSVAPAEVADHLALALFAIALSTGNFASQWYAFYCVDDWFDAQANAPTNAQTNAQQAQAQQMQAQQAQAHPAQMPVGAPSPAEAAPVMPGGVTPVTNVPDGSVILPDGRLVTPDGRVYVPQDQAVQQTSPAPGAPPAPDGARGAGYFYDKH